MKFFLTVASFIAISGLLIAGGDEAIQKDRKQMAGTWRVVSHEKDGKKLADELLAKTRGIVEPDGKLVVQENGKTASQATLKIDPAKKPKQVDIAYTEGDLKGKTVLGIYEIDGDNLKVCYALGKNRPTDFATKPGSGLVLTVYKRQLPPKLYVNNIGMNFTWIYPGSFVMGSQEKEEGRSPAETQHKVTLTKGFFMGVDLVTQEQWQTIMGFNPSHFKGEKTLPVENVSWDDCQVFCKKLSDKDKKQYRLPTEAEWEYACRAGTTTPFYFGDKITSDLANYNGEEVYGKGNKSLYRAQSTPVGTFPANPWGLHDMHGNVWQWCQDWYADYPKDAVDPHGPDKGSARVVRGGARFNSPAFCRSASRNSYLPGYRSSYIGFRVCFGE